MVENQLQNEAHYAKVEASTEKRREVSRGAMNVAFWFGVLLSLLASAALIGTYLMRHGSHPEQNEPEQIQGHVAIVDESFHT